MMGIKVLNGITFNLATEVLKLCSKERIGPAHQEVHQDGLCSVDKTHPLSFVFVPSLFSGYSGLLSVALSSPSFSNIPKVPTSHLKVPLSMSLTPFQFLLPHSDPP